MTTEFATTDEGVVATDPATPTGPARTESARRWLNELGAIDRFATVVLGLLLVALAPGFYYVTNPRYALVLVSLPLGAWLLVRRSVIGRDPAAVAAVGFVGVAVVATLMVGEYRLATLFGTATTDISVLAFLTAFGWWAIGRELSPEGRRAVPLVLTVGFGINVVVSVYQVLANPSNGIYHTFSGRASGLMSNPVYFASAFIGVWAYWLVKAGQMRTPARLGLVAGVAFGVGLSGSRGAIAGGAVVMLAVLARQRRSSIVPLLASVVGFVAGLGLLGLLTGPESKRLGDVDGGLAVRVELWKTTLDAYSDRPLLGWGPNPSLHQVNTGFGEAAVREYGRMLWGDPHNVIILVLVTVGLVGLAVLAAFVVLSLRGQIDGVLLAGAVAIVLSWMLQPVIVSGWPLAFVCLGAAVRPRTIGVGDAREDPEPGRRFVVVAMVIGLTLGLSFAVWSVLLRSALDAGDADLADTRAGWLIHDPAVAKSVGVAHKEMNVEGAELERHLDRAAELAAVSIARGGGPDSWELLVTTQIFQERFDAAHETALQWVSEWPNDTLGFQVLLATANMTGDSNAAARASEKVCALVPPWCDDGAAGD